MSRVGDGEASDDPVASRISWKPLRHQGNLRRTRRLVRTGLHRCEFCATAVSLSLAGVFILAGAVIFFWPFWHGGFRLDKMTAMIYLWGVAFVLAGIYSLYTVMTPIVFDHQTGAFWVGRGEPNADGFSRRAKRFVELEEIHALQLVSEFNFESSGFRSFELNLVLKDGERINVADHADQDGIRDDAAKLGVFLGIPVWDALD